MRTKLTIEPQLLAETWRLLHAAGRLGFEATVFWIGTQRDDHRVLVHSIRQPAQTAIRTSVGVSVRVDDEALTALIDGLEAHEHVAARVHSHPGDAYHSDTDDKNLVLAHEGAISIVVPDFAAGSPDLQRCAVYQLHRTGWKHLNAEQTAATIETS